MIIRPQPGPQTLLSACSADIAVFGGKAGGGKSFGLVMEAGRWFGVPNYAGVLFRRTSTDLEKAGGLWPKGRQILKALGGRARGGSDRDVVWENGATVQFRGCEHEMDVEEWQGTELDFVGLDELTHFTEYQFWYLVTRLRSAHGRIKPYLRATTNPDPDSWVRRLVDYWIGPDGLAIKERSGVIRWIVRQGDDLRWFDTKAAAQAFLDTIGDKDSMPMSFTFIHSDLEDNAELMKNDPGYRGRLAIQDAVTRSRLLGGNWNARAVAGALFNRSWFGVVDTMPMDKDVSVWVRGWDFAASAPTPEYPDPDWTRGVLWALLKNGKLVCCDVVSMRDAPGAVEGLLAKVVMQDGPKVIQAIWQDPAAGGKFLSEHAERAMRVALPSVEIRSLVEKKDKVSYASPLSARIDPRERHNQIQAYVVRGPWNSAFFSELEAFPAKEAKKDQVDASSRAFIELEKGTFGFAANFGRAMDSVGIV